MEIVILGAGTAGLIAALIIREKYPHHKITIVKSSEIGIIGVGEGSTEHWNTFMKFVGISNIDLIKNTSATVKIGILFKNWNLNSEYVHSVCCNSLSPLSRPDKYIQMMKADIKFPLSPAFDKYFYNNLVPLNESLQVSNQYHFDTFKLNNYLTNICKNRKIDFLDMIIDTVSFDENGNVKSISNSEMAIEADFFIDCSGFKRIITNKMGLEWKSMSKYLPMNHAIAFPTEFEDYNQIEPYTLSEAYDCGWTWKIPTQERYGNGYVFCDNYIDPDNALHEINEKRKKDNKTPVDKFARDIKFEAGKLEKFWHKNVLSIGLASSFAEPLEAQSIGFSIMQAFIFIEHLDRWEYNKNVSNSYNEILDKIFFNIIDYLQLHYFTNRNDTPFWIDKPFEHTDFFKENMESIKNGIIDPSMFAGSVKMFNLDNFMQVLHGLGFFTDEIRAKLVLRNTEYFNDKIANDAKAEFNLHRIQPFISHRDFLNLVCQNN